MSLSFCRYLTPFPVNTHWQRRGITGKHPPATGKKKRPLKDWKLLKTFWFISGDVLSQFPEEVRSAESTEGLTTYSGNGWGVFTEIYLIILWINCRSNGPLDLTVEGQPVGYFCHTVGFGMLHADQCRRWRSQNNPENVRLTDICLYHQVLGWTGSSVQLLAATYQHRVNRTTSGTFVRHEPRYMSHSFYISVLLLIRIFCRKWKFLSL